MIMYCSIAYLLISLPFIYSFYHYTKEVLPEHCSLTKSVAFGLFSPITISFKLLALFPALVGVKFMIVSTVESDSDAEFDFRD